MPQRGPRIWARPRAGVAFLIGGRHASAFLLSLRRAALSLSRWCRLISVISQHYFTPRRRMGFSCAPPLISPAQESIISRKQAIFAKLSGYAGRHSYFHRPTIDSFSVKLLMAFIIVLLMAMRKHYLFKNCQQASFPRKEELYARQLGRHMQCYDRYLYFRH